MPLSAFQRPVQSKPTVDFLDGVHVNDASANTDLILPGRDPFWFVRAISIVSVQNLAWELQVYSKAVNLGGDFDTDNFLGVWQFGVLAVGPPASPGWPVGVPTASPGDSLYHFYVDGNMMPYYDADQLAASQATGYPNNAKLHVRLINRSATPKTAGAPGAVLVTFFMATQGQQV